MACFYPTSVGFLVRNSPSHGNENGQSYVLIVLPEEYPNIHTDRYICPKYTDLTKRIDATVFF